MKHLDSRSVNGDKPQAGKSGRTNSVVSQLLTVRLAEATASRELLFRELVAVLKQESNAKRSHRPVQRPKTALPVYHSRILAAGKQ
ncbi:MAG: hypothetical protein IPK98_16880 [Chloracidobacterium sp.]|nr:hypothetical protein [Chloracidobacterium sp.]